MIYFYSCGAISKVDLAAPGEVSTPVYNAPRHMVLPGAPVGHEEYNSGEDEDSELEVILEPAFSGVTPEQKQQYLEDWRASLRIRRKKAWTLDRIRIPLNLYKVQELPILYESKRHGVTTELKNHLRDVYSITNETHEAATIGYDRDHGKNKYPEADRWFANKKAHWLIPKEAARRWIVKTRQPLFAVELRNSRRCLLRTDKSLPIKAERGEVLGFVQVQGVHTDESLAKLVLATLKELGSEQKLFAITDDIAVDNGTLCQWLFKYLSKHYDDEHTIHGRPRMQFYGEYSWIRCLAHIVALICNSVLIELKCVTAKLAQKTPD
ncbi:hypothetical protein BJ878DRAFT_571958 [Calycina marina]|uniref:Uncharacterized protein n=1 Tax=Calycina marina TaxID=1763456 RepID=A0A9P8CIY4_9HELO|nr:hypothetical protein BJ878DRAFT_571958 [Calycina marina]